MPLRHTLAVAVVLVALPAVADVPQEVAERLEAAVVPADGDDFAGTYRLLVESVVAKPSGKGRQEVAIEAEVEVSPAGDEARRLVRFLLDGEDQTEKQRADFEKPHESEDGEDDGEDELVVPVGEDAARFSFGPTREVDGELRVSFEPRREHAKDDGMSRGELAWDPDTLDPRWAVLEPVDPPSPMAELKLRLEYDRQDGTLFVRRMLTEGRVKILLMQRVFRADTRFEDIRPATVPAAEGRRLSPRS